MGESARRPGAPMLPLTPEELLTPGPGEGFSVIEKYGPKIVTAAACAGGPALNNLRLSRPFFAGIHYHFIFGVIGYVVGDWVFKFRQAQRSEKDAILLHYISLHPEDFPAFERQRYKDVFQSWTPKR